MPESQSPDALKILLVDDHPPLRTSIRRILKQRQAWEICGEAGNGREAVEKSLELRPSVVVMDISMPEMDGLEATRQIRRLAPEIEVLIFSQYLSPIALKAALDAGARGYLSKSRAENLTDAIQTVASHKRYPSSEDDSK